MAGFLDHLRTRRAPTILFQELKPEKKVEIAGYQVQAVNVSHTIDTAGFIVQGADALSRTAATPVRPTGSGSCSTRRKNLKALLLEVSFPDREQKLATVSGHHTPRTLLKDLKKLRKPKDLPTLLYHIKPVFQREVEQECARLKGVNLAVTAIGDQYVL